MNKEEQGAVDDMELGSSRIAIALLLLLLTHCCSSFHGLFELWSLSSLFNFLSGYTDNRYQFAFECISSKENSVFLFILLCIFDKSDPPFNCLISNHPVSIV